MNGQSAVFLMATHSDLFCEKVFTFDKNVVSHFITNLVPNERPHSVLSCLSLSF
jgi:hypothetical protein